MIPCWGFGVVVIADCLLRGVSGRVFPGHSPIDVPERPVGPSSRVGDTGAVANDKPRILHNSRDMTLSLIPLVAICVLFAALASQCSFAPFGPKAGPVPYFDVDAALQSDAASLDFPIRDPELPPDWRSNSGSRGEVAGDQGGEVSAVGFITGNGRYLQLTQSEATEATLVPYVAGDRRFATGTEQAGGANWVVYAEDGSEPIWVADLGDVRVLVTGSADHDEFVTLADAALRAEPIPA